MTVGRRDLLKVLATGGAATVTLETLLAPTPSRAAEMRLLGAKEFTTVCNFCSCGCAMVGHVIDGKLVNLEGDPDGVVNEGSLCVKGAAALATHDSKQRLTTPKYRAPGSDHWVDITWDEALDKVAKKLKATRDATWVATEKDGEQEFPVNRTDAIALLGGAQNTNEECYLWNKMGRIFGTNFVEHQARL
jgi:formate dehydrogenase major subunit